MKSTVVRKIANLLQARVNCMKSGNTEWLDKHTDRLQALVKEHLPSGSGFDSGTTLEIEASNPERLVFHTAFHHMDDGGSYDGWTEHRVIVRPSLASGFLLNIGGRNRNGIKELIEQAFDDSLSAEIERS